MIARGGRPLVTTVVRNYQRRGTVVRAIRSALAQTMADQPIILVDDASTDGGPDLVEAEFGDRVRILRHETNRGPGGAANTGLGQVETPFVAFLDSDDVWHPTYLARLVGTLVARPGSDLAYSDYRRWFEAQHLDMPMECREPARIGTAMDGILHTLSLAVFRTRAIRAVGGFREDIKIGEDHELTAKIWMRSPTSLIYVRECLVLYSFGVDNITGNHEMFATSTQRLSEEMLRHPAFRHLRGMRSGLMTNRLLAVARRQKLAAWTRAMPTRTVSLVIPVQDVDGEHDLAQSIEASLLSAAAQRLPPVEVLLVHPKGRAIDPDLDRQMPFPVRTIAYRTDGSSTLETTLAMAVGAAGGDIVTFLEPGDEWTPTALDDHRRAFSSTFGRIWFSYGGTPDTPLPAALSMQPGQVEWQILRHGAPGMLSAMAVDRRGLASMGGLPLRHHGALWLTLVLALVRQKGRAIRICRPVLARARPRRVGADAMIAILSDLADTEGGEHLNGFVDAALDDVDAGRDPFSEVSTGELSGMDPDWEHPRP